MKRLFRNILHIVILAVVLSLSILDPLFLFCKKTMAMSNVVVVIDPGHGGPGTTDKQELGAEYNNVVEKDLTLITAEAMKAELEQYGNVTVYMTRTTDQVVKLADRSAFAKSVGATVLISLHYNASAEHNYYGAEVFTSAFGQHYATGTGLASCFLEQLTASGAVNKGSKTRIGNSGTDYYGIIRHGVTNNVPTIIVEHGYIDNDTDWSRIGTVDAWRQLGVRDATAVAKYFGLQKGVVQADVVPTVPVNVPTTTMMPDLTEPEAVSAKAAYTDDAVEITVTAKEPESKLMYCTYSYDGGLTFLPLSLWGSGAEHVETITPPTGFSGNVIVRVYNNYELYTDSAPVAIEAPEKQQDEGETDKEGLTSNPLQGNTLSGNSAQEGNSAKEDDSINGDVSANNTISANTSLWEDELQNTIDDITIVEIETPESTSKTKTVVTAIIVIAAIVIGIILTIFAVRKIQHKKRKKRH